MKNPVAQAAVAVKKYKRARRMKEATLTAKKLKEEGKSDKTRITGKEMLAVGR